MKLLNNKAFTLIELLAVILIMGALAIVALPSVMRFVNQGYDEYNTNLEKQLVLGTKNYVLDHNHETFVKVDIKTLIQNNYLSNEPTDKSGNSCLNSFVIISDNEYIACLVCDNKKLTDDSKCNQ